MDGVRLMGFAQRSPMLAEGSRLPTMVAIHEECGERWVCRRAELGKDKVIFPITVGRFQLWRSPGGENCSLIQVQGKSTRQVEAGASVIIEL